jgi:hypothetical protein
MKNSHRDAKFTNSDFDSFLFWKVFWKMIRAESPIVFVLKVLACGAFLAVMTFVLFLTGEIAREWK